MTLETLVYELTADTSKLIEAENKATNETKKLDKELQKVEDTSNTLGKSLLSMVGGFVGAIASGFALSTFVGAIASAKEYTIALENTSNQLGIARDELSAFHSVAEQNGGTVDEFNSSIINLNEKINELGNSADTMISPALNRFGVSLKDTNGVLKTSTELMPELADMFSQISKQESANIGKKLGLDNATIRMLQMGRAELDEQIKTQKELFTVTDEQVEIFQKFDKALAQNKQAFRYLGTELGSTVMPILEYFIKKINGGIEFLAKHKDFAVGVIIALAGAITAYALPSMIRLGIATVTAFAPFYLIGAIIAGVAVAIGLLYEDLMVFLEGGTSGFQNMLEWLGFTGEEIEAIRQAFVLAGEQIGAIFATLGTIIQALFSGLVAGGRIIFETFEPVLKLIGEGLVGAIKTALGFIDTLSNAVGAVADWLGFGNKDVKVTKEDITKQALDVSVKNKDDKQPSKEDLSTSKSDKVEGSVAEYINKNNKDKGSAKASDAQAELDKLLITVDKEDTTETKPLENIKETKPLDVKDKPLEINTDNIKIFDTENKAKATNEALSVVSKAENNPINNITPNTINQMSNSKTQNNQVKIDKIEIQTQATDSQAISKTVGASLQSELKSAVANFDDGIEA